MELKFYVGNTVFNNIEDYMNIEEFFQKTEDWISQDKAKWNFVTLMAYFCHKYNENYGIQYKFARWKGDPGKTKEIRDISKIYKALKESTASWDSEFSEKKVNILKTYNYINWVFDRKFRGKTKVNSTGLLVNHTLMNEFEKLYAAKMRQSKENNKLSSLKQWISKNTPSIVGEYSFEDMNDLKIFIKFFESNEFEEGDEEVAVYNYIKERGLQ